MDEADLERLAYQVADIFRAASTATVAVIARRLREIGELSTTDAYNLIRASESLDLEEIREIINDAGGLAVDEMERVLSDVATANDDWARVYYNAAGIDYRGYTTSQLQMATVQQAYDNFRDEIINLTGSTGFDIGNEYRTIREAYLSSLNQGVVALSSGADYVSVVRRRVRELSAKGLVAVEFPSGRKVRLDSVVRMNVQGGARQVYNQLRHIQGQEFGADGVEISAHAICAPDHQPIQGRQFSNEQWSRISAGLQRQIGTLNCRHIIFPVIMGVSSTAYNTDQLQDINDRSNETTSWIGLSGKRMTATRYDATQYQRRVELAIKDSKSVTEGFTALGDTVGAESAKRRTRQLQKQYRRISEQMGLPVQGYRTR